MKFCQFSAWNFCNRQKQILALKTLIFVLVSKFCLSYEKKNLEIRKNQRNVRHICIKFNLKLILENLMVNWTLNFVRVKFVVTSYRILARDRGKTKNPKNVMQWFVKVSMSFWGSTRLFWRLRFRRIWRWECKDHYSTFLFIILKFNDRVRFFKSRDISFCVISHCKV